MKKIYTIIAAVLFFTNAIAQTIKDHTQLMQMEIPNSNAVGNWQEVGPFNTDRGMGRVNCIAFIDADTWLVGTAGGGLWKTDVAGVYLPNVPPYDKPWTPLTDKTAAATVSGIAVKPSAPNKIYILTGDGDRKYEYLGMGDYIYDENIIPGAGLLKTADGGATWSETALQDTDYTVGHKLVMNPTNANRMYAATDKGLFITGDGWATKSVRLAGQNIWDIEIHPTNANIIYIATDTAVYKSTDGLVTEPQQVSYSFGFNGADRISIAVCPAAPDNLYVASSNEIQGFAGLDVSTNKGGSFINLNNGYLNNILGGSDGLYYKYQEGSPHYNFAFAVDPVNPNKMMIGGINIHVSYSQGTFWAQATEEESTGDNYVHKSIHAIEFNPYNSSVVCGTEGGIYASPGNDDSYWEKRWAGMNIAQYNYFDVNNSSAYFATEIIGGAMDNGTHANSTAGLLSTGNSFSPLSFDRVGEESGYYCFSGTQDETDYRYTEDGTGHLFLQERNNLSGWSATDISQDIHDDANLEGPTGNSGVTMAVNPNEFQSLIANYTLYDDNFSKLGDVSFSNNFGNSWQGILLPDSLLGSTIISWNKNNTNNVAVAVANRVEGLRSIAVTNQLYAGVISNNYNWKVYDVKSRLQGNEISDIQFTDDVYPNNILFTVDGYKDTAKIFKLTKDTVWKNLTYNLPNVRVRCAAVDDYGIYAGTDIGVYFLADKDSVWTYFSKGLPIVPVTRIEVVQDLLGRRVYCSTFGRGIWKSDPAPPKRITRYYVNKTAAGANTGESWTNAFIKLQDALNKAIPGDTIWVAKGTYLPTSTSAISGGSASRLYTFIVDSNTVMYGGFYGDETRLEQRNPALYETILSGNLGDTAISTDNAYHVLTIQNSSKNSFIDGFTIKDGRADGSFTSNAGLQRGAAFYVYYDSLKGGRPFFTNCVFKNNVAAGGGAAYIAQKFKTSSAKTSFIKCTFKNNSSFDNGSGNRGGAIYFDCASPRISPFGSMAMVIDSCVFEGNSSYNGGAIYNDAAGNAYINYSIKNTSFLHNKNSNATSGYGGAISNNTNQKGVLKLILDSCTFFDNDAANAGGSIYNGGSSTLNDDDTKIYIKNCSFDSCSGYAVYLSQGKVFLSVNKSAFTNNTGGIAAIGSTSIGINSGTIAGCTFNNNSTGLYLACGNSGTGFTNRSLNYTIDSCTFNNNSYGLYLNHYSQGQNAKQAQYTLSNSTFTGNTSGAVYNLVSDNGNMTAVIKKNIFNNNKGSYGAAVYTNGYQNGYVDLTVDSCNFSANKASLYGGALYNYHLDKLAVTNCNFSNDSSASGGAIYTYTQYKNVLCTNTFRNNTYTNNVSTGSGGAAVFSNNGSAAMNIDMVKNIFTGNKAAYYGGSLYVANAASSDTVNVNIDSCNFYNSNTTLNTTQSHGGALYLYCSGGTLIPSIKNTEFKNNHTAARGGAIYAEVSNFQKLNLLVLKCNIESNSSDTYGGGLTLASFGTTNLNVDSSTLKSNTAVLAIGGIYMYQNNFQMNASITNTTFDGNNSPGYSGALQINADGPIVGSANKCVFKNNAANGGVAGAVRLYAYSNDLNDFDFTNCLFDNNTASGDGGAAYIQTDDRGTLNNKFDNCVFNKNKAARGGALYITALNYSSNISVPLTNCTITNNNATVETGGIYATKANSSAVVRADMVNTILWNNTDTSTVSLAKKQAYVTGGALGAINNCIIKDGIPTGYADSGFNLLTDPLFINANDVDGTDNKFATADDGLSVKSGSPAINAGATVAISADITGLARPQGAAYDIGAYEKNACSLGTVTGLTLNNAASCSLKYTWTAVSGATSYETEYKVNSSGTWISSGTVTATQQTITGLSANTAYDFRVRAKNNAGCTGSYAQLLNRKTDLYDEPENPTEINITATTAKLQWQVPACGAAPLNYTIMGKPASGSNWITINTSNKFYNATGLSPNTQYTWKVRANYSGGSSAYTAQRNFTTLASTVALQNDSLIMSENLLTVSGQRSTASLFQNMPNPFSNKTIIKCYVPQNNGHAYLNVYSNTGIVLKSIIIMNEGMNVIEFDAGQLSSGTYQYALMIDGRIEDKKMMVIQK